MSQSALAACTDFLEVSADSNMQVLPPCPENRNYHRSLAWSGKELFLHSSEVWNFWLRVWISTQYFECNMLPAHSGMLGKNSIALLLKCKQCTDSNESNIQIPPHPPQEYLERANLQLFWRQFRSYFVAPRGINQMFYHLAFPCWQIWRNYSFFR